MKNSILSDKDVSNAFGMVGEFANQVQQPGTVHVVKNSLNGGELSRGMGARFDQQRYISGCHTLLNMCPLPCGGVAKRPGLVYLGASGQTSDAYQARLIPFIFSAAQSAVLEFAETERSTVIMRVWTTGGLCSGQMLELPWARGTLADVSFCQSADVIFCASGHFKPGKIMRYGDYDWRWQEINWMPPINPPRIKEITEEGKNEGGLIGQHYVATAIDPETGLESCASESYYILCTALNSSHTLNIEIEPIPGISEYRIYKRTAGVYGFVGRITGGVYFNDRNIAPDTEDTPPNYQDPFASADERPSLVFMHQQRLGFAGSLKRPLTIWLSQAGNLESMAASIPPKADDAIEATLAAPQANKIIWCQSDRTGLAIGTEGGEWLLASSEGAAITPSDLSFQPQTYFGSEQGLPVLRAGSNLLYTQRGGQAVREFGYSFTDDRYQSNDLSLLARHILAGNPVASWCWQPEPHGIIWCALYDGTFAGLTYLREHDVIAWHRHHSPDGWIESMTSIPAPNGSWQVWALVFRKNESGQWLRGIEKLADFFDGTANAIHTDGPSQATFLSVCSPCLMESQDQNGSTFGLFRKINNLKIRVINSGPFQARVSSQNKKPSTAVKVGNSYQQEADWICYLGAGFRDNAKIELFDQSPNPLTILGLVASIELSTELGNQ